MGDPAMTSDDLPVRRHEIALRNLFTAVLLYKPCIVLIWHKADLHAVRLVCHIESQLLGNRTDLALLIGTDRHFCTHQLLLCQIVQGICLILCRRHRIADRIAAILQLLNPGVMACCDEGRTDLHAALQQGLPFDIAVAGDTRVRRPPV